MSKKTMPVFKFTDGSKPNVTWYTPEEHKQLNSKKEVAEVKKESTHTFINKTKIKVPKKYHHMIDELFPAPAEDGGYWLYARDGYFIGYEDYGIHIGRYDTVKEILMVIGTLEKCECEECI